MGTGLWFGDGLLLCRRVGLEEVSGYQIECRIAR